MVRQKPAKLLSPSSNLGVAFFLKGGYMGKIFGISDLPVTTIKSPLEPIEIPSQQIQKVVKKYYKNIPTSDYFSSSTPKAQPANPIIKKRFGIGKLMGSNGKPVK